jgi:hypothetical protein
MWGGQWQGSQRSRLRRRIEQAVWRDDVNTPQAVYRGAARLDIPANPQIVSSVT